MRLAEVPPERYAREVLPLTAPLWSGRRDFETYVTQTLEIARGAYGRRRYRTIGLYDGKRLVASFKRYERDLYDGTHKLPAIGFGAVYTPVEYRGRGYASIMLAAELDRARQAGCELAYLFSDIRPQFYAALGFATLPSSNFSLRADALPAQRVLPARLQETDWDGVRRCFDYAQRRPGYGFLRDRGAWSWIRMRIAHGSEAAAGHIHNLVVRRGRAVRAYVLGTRIPERDAYVLDEFGFADEAAAAIVPALVRAAAGDLRRVTGWVPPQAFRRLLPRGTVRKRERSVLMIAPLRAAGRAMLERALAERGNFCWATEHI